jgi:DNA-binding protein H-NS
LMRVQSVSSAKRVRRTFKPTAPRNSMPPKYRDPATGATWSGRGKAPRWLTGHDRDEFLIRSA